MAESTPTILVINGPNLNLLGVREPKYYGTATLADVERRCADAAAQVGLQVECHQSNHEGAIVDLIQYARENCAGILINPAAFSFTSIAILDAILAVGKPVVEVHISNIHQREEFRHRSFVSYGANAVIAGAGVNGYEFAIRHLASLIEEAG